MEPKSIVGKFVETLAASRDAGRSVAIGITNDPALDLPRADEVVKGSDWAESIEPGACYDLVVVDLPLGMGRQKTNIGASSISVRGNWLELSKALGLIGPAGLCIAIVEPPAFGISEGPKFLEALEAKGFNLNGVFNVPPNLLSTTSIRPVIVAFSRETRAGLFVAELEDEAQASSVAHAFVSGVTVDSLHEGMLLENGKFDGFESLKARLQLERLETQYKDYKAHVLGDLAVEMNAVRSGELLEVTVKPNCSWWWG